MKILMVNKFLYPNGGSETYMFELGKKLSSIGHEVQYFGMDHPNRCVSNSLGLYTKPVDFHKLSKFDKLVYSLKTINSHEAKRKIIKVLNEFNPDVVHLNNFNYQLTPSIIEGIKIWKKKSKKFCRIIYTAHDYQLICPNHMLNNPNTHKNCELCVNGNFSNCYKGKCIHCSKGKSLIGFLEAKFWYKKKIYRNIDKIICVSEFMKSMMDKNPLFKCKTVVIPNFTSFEKRKFAKKNYVLYYGRMCEEKGFDELLNYVQNNPKIKLVIAGKGPLEDSIPKIDNIIYVGFKTGEELKTLIGEAKFTVVPSKWYEPFGLTVIESIMLGTPVLASKVGGIKELIDDGINGVLFEWKNGGFAKAFDELYYDDEKISFLTSNCEKTEFMNVSDYVDKIIKIYE